MKKLLLCLLFTVVIPVKGQDLIRFDSEGKVGFKNNAGKIVVPAYYEYPRDFPDGLLGIKLNDKYGFIDITGKIIIPCIYDQTKGFIEGLSIVSLNEKVFIIDKNGKEKVALKYDKLGFGYTTGRVFHVGLDKRWGLIDHKGNELVYPKYEKLLRFNENLLVFAKFNNKWGIIDRSGNIVKPFVFSELAKIFNNKKSYYRVKTDTKFGVIDSQGNEILPLIYERINYYSLDPYVEFQFNGKIGYLNSETKEIAFVELSKENELIWIEFADSIYYYD